MCGCAPLLAHRGDCSEGTPKRWQGSGRRARPGAARVTVAARFGVMYWSPHALPPVRFTPAGQHAGVTCAAGPACSFGYQVGIKQAMELLTAARDGGCNFFDNAEVYAKGQAEEIMGKAIKASRCGGPTPRAQGLPARWPAGGVGGRALPGRVLNGRARPSFPQELGWKRSDMVISTKIFWGGDGPNDKGLSRKHIVEGTKVGPRAPRLALRLAQLQGGCSVCAAAARPQPIPHPGSAAASQGCAGCLPCVVSADRPMRRLH